MKHSLSVVLVLLYIIIIFEVLKRPVMIGFKLAPDVVNSKGTMLTTLCGIYCVETISTHTQL